MFGTAELFFTSPALYVWLRTLFPRFSPYAAAGHKPLLQQPVFHTFGGIISFYEAYRPPFCIAA
mgnify:FL=1